MSSAARQSGDDLPLLPAAVNDELLTILFGDLQQRDNGLQRLLAQRPECSAQIAAHVAWHDGQRGLVAPVSAPTGAVWRTEPPRRSGPAPGSTFGNFHIERHLGQGGMGDVFLARQTSLDRRVALKVIRGDRVLDAAARERFRREARAVADLRHPGICTVLEVGEVDGTPYLAMQFVEGETLDARLAAQRSQAVALPSTASDVRAVLQMGVRLAEALHAAHEAGVVHRDVKPANIMLDTRGEPVLLDFGLARELERPPSDATLTLSGVAVGTPPYMSPEQIRPRRPVDRRTDVYSLAVTLFECLAGHRPFRAHDPLTLCEQIERDPTPDPRRSNTQLPVDLTAVLAMAMEKDPARRYATAREFAQDLEHICKGEPVRARRIGSAGRLWRWTRRNPLAAGLVASLLAGLLTTTLLLRVSNEQANTLRTTADKLTERQRAYDLLSQVVHLENARKILAEIFPVRDVVSARARFAAAVAPLRQAVTDLRLQLARFRADAGEWTVADQLADFTGHPRHPALQGLQRQVAQFRRVHELRMGDPAERALDLPFDAMQATEKELVTFVSHRIGTRATVSGEELAAFAATEVLFDRVMAGKSVVNPLGVVAWMVQAFEAVGAHAEVAALGHRMMNAEDPQIRTGMPSSLGESFLQGLRAELLRIRNGSAAELQRLEASLAALDAEVRTRRTWRMRRPEDDFLHGRLSVLAPEIDTFLAGDIRVAEARLAWAEREHELTIVRHRDRWEAARAAIRKADGIVASALYGEGFELAPQPGLVPIGMNPVTGLWEFYHLQSAWDSLSDRDPATLPIPCHDAQGHIDVLPETGIVFVLVPAGVATLGCQSDDPAQPHFDPQCVKREEHPVDQVPLDAFFLARHELTEGQWLRLDGQPVSALKLPFDSHTSFGYVPNARLPERYEIGNHPTNGQTAPDFEGVLRPGRLGLPTSAQWEYACRAGTASIWPCGDDPASLEGHANVLDLRSCGRQLNQGTKVECAMFDDGFKILSPVGVLRPNRWGFHDMLGNVAEWCADDCAFYSVERARPGDGWRVMRSQGDRWRDVRGGSYKDPPPAARSAARKAVEASASSLLHGVRVLRAVTR